MTKERKQEIINTYKREENEKKPIKLCSEERYQ